MTFKLDYLAELPDVIELIDYRNIQINGIKFDSRKVENGDLFICLYGDNTDGHKYANDAIKNGAAALITERKIESCNIPQILVRSSREACSILAQKYYDNSVNKLKLVAVTGTTGKTSIAYLIHQGINICSDNKSSLIGTAGYFSRDRKLDMTLNGSVTTPEPFELNYLFNKFYEDGSEFAILEASSFGMTQKRLYGIEFDTAVLSNVSFSHHIKYHGSFENYVKAKTDLFRQIKNNSFAVLNSDSEYLSEFKKSSHKYITYGYKSNSDILIEDVLLSDNDTNSFMLKYNGKKYQGKTRLPGIYNIYNIAAAFGAGLALNFDSQLYFNSLLKIDKIPGRWDIIGSDHPSYIIIDKANTPIAIENITKQINSSKYKTKIAVFGNVGGGDKSERARLAKMIQKLFDKIIITTDDPEFEDPHIGINDFLSGIDSDRMNDCYIELNREDAIKKAITLGGSGDLIAIIGRGNQREFLISGKTLDFDDTIVTRKILIEKGYKVEN